MVCSFEFQSVVPRPLLWPLTKQTTSSSLFPGPQITELIAQYVVGLRETSKDIPCFVSSLHFLLSEMPVHLLCEHTCGSSSASLHTASTPESSDLVGLFILCPQGLSHHGCECRQTSEALRALLRTTAVKRVVIFLLVEGLAFNMLKKKKKNL